MDFRLLIFITDTPEVSSSLLESQIIPTTNIKVV